MESGIARMPSSARSWGRDRSETTPVLREVRARGEVVSRLCEDDPREVVAKDEDKSYRHPGHAQRGSEMQGEMVGGLIGTACRSRSGDRLQRRPAMVHAT